MRKKMVFLLAGVAALLVLLAALVYAALPPAPLVRYLPHDTLLTAYTRAHGREDLYVRAFAYDHGFIQDQGRYSLDHGWGGNIEQLSVLVCPIRRVGGEIEARFIHDTRLEGDCPLRGNY